MKTTTKKYVAVNGYNFPTLEQWMKLQSDAFQEEDGPEIIKLHRENIPANFIGIESETNNEKESAAWDALDRFFGHENVCSASWGEAVHIQRNGVEAIVTGDMTWTVFVDPKELELMMTPTTKRTVEA